MNDENAEMVARYQAIMDGAPIDGPIDADARAAVVKWLAKFRPATNTRPDAGQGAQGRPLMTALRVAKA